MKFDPEMPITFELLEEVGIALSMREEVPARLLYRIMLWAAANINERQRKLDTIRRVFNEEPQ